MEEANAEYENLLSSHEAVNLDDLHENMAVSRLMDELNAKTEALSSSSRTNALWIQYIELVDLLNSSITAERTGINNYISNEGLTNQVLFK